MDLSACAGHSAVVTDSGDLYTWGSSEDQGVLGHGAGKWQPTPKRVLGLKRVTKGTAPPFVLPKLRHAVLSSVVVWQSASPVPVQSP